MALVAHAKRQAYGKALKLWWVLDIFLGHFCQAAISVKISNLTYLFL